VGVWGGGLGVGVVGRPPHPQPPQPQTPNPQSPIPIYFFREKLDK